MSDLETKRSTENALTAFATQPLKAAATGLFIALGYASKKTLDLKPNGREGCRPGNASKPADPCSASR